MDPVVEIKSRLPIEELVRQYCALTKKGRNYVALCPFHHDKRPSMLVSPDKGIAYCFPCQKGGDIFSFYQAAEGVDFIQALKDLAEKTGVVLPDDRAPKTTRDEKERGRQCLESALHLFRQWLKENASAMEYLKSRGVTDAEIETFELGYAPDSYTQTYETLLKQNYSRTELSSVGLAVVKDLQDDRMYDRFRHRLMFPIRDLQARLAGFGGRTLGGDDAKYMNSSDGPLFHKSEILFGLAQARDAMREKRRAIVVEGYFDVLACHRLGYTETIATCGTALTEQHARLLKRHVDTVILCLDQDRAGQEASERAFGILSHEGLIVQALRLSDKDPADAVLADADGLRAMLESGGSPYLDLVIGDIAKADHATPKGRRDALQRILRLLAMLDSSVERAHYLGLAATALGTTQTAMEEDLAPVLKEHRGAAAASAASEAHAIAAAGGAPVPASSADQSQPGLFSAEELAVALIALYPSCRHFLHELIPPENGMPAAVYGALKAASSPAVALDALDLPAEHRERLSVIHLYCEEQGLGDWSESVALREVRQNCQTANRDSIRRRQQAITQKLVEARRNNKKDEEQALQSEFLDLLKLAKKTE